MCGVIGEGNPALNTVTAFPATQVQEDGRKRSHAGRKRGKSRSHAIFRAKVENVLAIGFQRSVAHPNEVISDAAMPLNRHDQYCGYVRIQRAAAGSVSMRWLR